MSSTHFGYNLVTSWTLWPYFLVYDCTTESFLDTEADTFPYNITLTVVFGFMQLLLEDCVRVCNITVAP